MPRPPAFVHVDEQLCWVVPVPECVLGSARSATPEHIARARAGFDAAADDLTRHRRPRLDDLAALAARLALSALADLPELPFVGEPFGGEEGTD